MGPRRRRLVPLTKAAAQLGVGVMGSGPLGEGSVLKNAGPLVRGRPPVLCALLSEGRSLP